MQRMHPRPGRAARPALLAATLLVLAVLLTGAAPAGAQEAGEPTDGRAAPAPAEAAADVERVVHALFDAMRAGDSAAARRLFAPEARLERPVESGGGTELRVVPVERFLASIGGADAGRLDEEIWDVEVRVDGKLATAWMPYLFHLDGEFHHCGVNAFRLYRTPDGWKIFGISDTSRTEGCPEPPGR